MFPVPEQFDDLTFFGWGFHYNDDIFYVTQQEYSDLNKAINEGYDDIELIAVYLQN